MSPLLDRAKFRNAVARMHRVTSAFRRVLDVFPFTFLGLAVLALSAGVLWTVAFPTMDMVVLVAAYAGFALVAFSALMVIVLAVILRARRSDPPAELLRLEAGRRAPTGFDFPWLAWLPIVRVDPAWHSPEGFEVTTRRQGLRLVEHVTASGRTHVPTVTRRLRVSDVLGLSAVSIRWTSNSPVEALPHPGQLGRLRSLRSFAGGDEMPHPMGLDDGDRVELRRYGPGDPARFIHWKVFGRTRRLMVRVPERALSRARRTIAYFVAGELDEASAGAARVAIEQGTLGADWVFGADGTPAACTEPSTAVQAIVRSREHRTAQGKALARFVERAEKRGPASLVVFAPASPGPWVQRVLSIARYRPQGLKVVIAVDRIVSRRRGSPVAAVIRAALFRPARSEGAAQSDTLDEVLAKLRPARVEVLILDRPSGRVVSGSTASARVTIGNAA